jgi:Zn finger protein HypA/HybF involved in hydrogenase expression
MNYDQPKCIDCGRFIAWEDWAPGIPDRCPKCTKIHDTLTQLQGKNA